MKITYHHHHIIGCLSLNPDPVSQIKYFLFSSRNLKNMKITGDNLLKNSDMPFEWYCKAEKIQNMKLPSLYI